MVREMGPILSSSLPQHNTFVNSHSGLCLEKAPEIASSLLKDHGPGDSIVLHVGTNNVGSDNLNVLINKYEDLLRTVKRTAPHSKVFVCALAHRISPGSAHDNMSIDQLNSYLRFLCVKDPNFVFVDNNPELLEANYMKDGLHFGLSGKNAFVKCLVHNLSKVQNFPLPPTFPDR